MDTGIAVSSPWKSGTQRARAFVSGLTPTPKPPRTTLLLIAPWALPPYAKRNTASSRLVFPELFEPVTRFTRPSLSMSSDLKPRYPDIESEVNMAGLPQCREVCSAWKSR